MHLIYLIFHFQATHFLCGRESRIDGRGKRGYNVAKEDKESNRMQTGEERFSRTERVLGNAGMERLANARVAVFGIGGVGGHVAEALVRSGLGRIDLIDPDVVAVSNINRQIFATDRTVGMRKVDAAAERLRAISPACEIRIFPLLFLPETADRIRFADYDYVVDAIDNVSGKIQIILSANEAGVPVISSMGTGNKVDPSKLRVGDVFETRVCPLARVMRHELRKRGIDRLRVVYSEETPVAVSEQQIGANGKPVPGSVSFVPSVAGLLMAAEVVRALCGEREISDQAN